MTARKAEIKTSPLMADVYAERKPGCCAFCDMPIGRTPGVRPKVQCGHEDCLRAYRSAYGYARRAAAKVVLK